MRLLESFIKCCEKSLMIGGWGPLGISLLPKSMQKHYLITELLSYLLSVCAVMHSSQVKIFGVSLGIFEKKINDL